MGWNTIKKRKRSITMNTTTQFPYENFPFKLQHKDGKEKKFSPKEVVKISEISI